MYGSIFVCVIWNMHHVGRFFIVILDVPLVFGEYGQELLSAFRMYEWLHDLHVVL